MEFGEFTLAEFKVGNPRCQGRSALYSMLHRVGRPQSGGLLSYGFAIFPGGREWPACRLSLLGCGGALLRIRNGVTAALGQVQAYMN
jgi:hypothetical protein